MKTKLFDNAVMRTAQEALDFIGNVVESSTEYSVIGKDLDGKILLWNEGARRMYGYEAAEVVGKVNSEVLHTPEDVAQGRPREMMRAALRDGKWEGVIGRVRKDRRRITARVVITPRRDAAGQPIGFLLISKDVSNELRFVEDISRAKLFDSGIVGNAQEAVDFITNILESSTEYSVIGKDLDGKILLWNEGARRLYGYEPEEVVGRANSSILHAPEDVRAGKPREILQSALQNGKWEGTISRMRKNGERFTARVVITPRRDSAGRAIGYLLISKDISDEIRLTEELKATQFYTRSLIESNIDALMTTDPLGIITDVNRQMEALTGYARDELLGTPFKNYFTDPKRAEEGIRLVLHEGKVTNYELTALSRDRRMTVVSYNASTFRDAAGRLQGVFAAARDITEQKKLEQQLRDSQAYNRGLIESSVDGLITVDPEGFITDVNEQMCRMTDYGRQALVGSPFKRYFTDPERAGMGVRRTLAEGVVTNYELVLKTRTGRKATVSFNASIFRGADGRVQGIFASARDISEQARLQAQLAEQQVYNRSLIEASADALFAIAPDGTITDVNEEATRLTGYSRKHLINSRFKDYFTESERAQAGVQQTLDERRVIGYELVLITRYGRRITVSFNAGVFTDTAGAPLGILAAARDITAQKELELQLRDQQFRTRSLIESNIDALMTTDPLGVITDVNQQVEALTGAARDELIGSPFKTYFTDPARAEDGIRKVLSEGKVTNYELTARGKDGRETVVSYNAATLFDRDGKLQGVFAAARDVTERKRFEHTLQEKNLELENANLAKDRFLASMSHELRTPLNAIIGFTGTLLMGLPGPLTGEQHQQLETIQGSAKHLLSLINDLLDLAKIESGKVELNFEPVACRGVMEEVAEALRPLAEAKSLRFEVQVPHDDLVLRTDRRALSQILLNLINNAIKFTDQGHVRLHANRVQDNGRRRIEISVTDTGIGIRPEDQARLFQAFEQVEAAGSRRREGTGLGLHLSQKLAVLLGGHIAFESEPGRGSTFTLVIGDW